MDLKPGARSVFVHFAFAFSRSSPARAIEKAFGTSCNRTDSSCLSQDALSAGATIFLKPSDIPVHANENGIQSWENWFLRISYGRELDARPASHRQNGLIGSGDLIQFRKKIGIALSLNGKPIDLEWNSLLFESILEFFIQESDLPLTASHADGCTPSTTHIQNLLETLPHFFDLIKSFSFPDNHLLPPCFKRSIRLLPHMTSPTILGNCFFLFCLNLPVATDALVVKSLFQIELGLRAMASRTTDFLIPFLKFTFVQNVFPIFIEVMAVLARQSCFNMAVMRKRHRRSCLPFQYNFIGLRSEGRPGQYQKKSNGDHQNFTAYRFHAFFLQSAPLFHYNQLSEKPSSS